MKHMALQMKKKKISNAHKNMSISNKLFIIIYKTLDSMALNFLLYYINFGLYI